MKTITKALFTLTLLCLPLGSIKVVDPSHQHEHIIVDAANELAEKYNLPSRVCLGTDPRAVGQMADRILPRNDFEGIVIHDEDVKSFLVENGLDLETLWEEQFPHDQPDGILQSISSILGFGPTERNQGIDSLQEALLEGNLDEEQRAALEYRLSTISKHIRAALQDPVATPSNPFSGLFLEGDEDIKEKLTSTLLEYFKLESILARAAKGDGYILELPSTPLMIVSGNTNRVLSFARLKQEVQDDESLQKRIDCFANELFNNHRYDGSDPYWSEEATEQRKKLHSRIILGSMALGWCGSACAYKLHYDLVKAEKATSYQDKATEQRITEPTTPQISKEKNEAVHKRARTRVFSFGSLTEDIGAEEKIQTTTAVHATPIEPQPDSCQRNFKVELLDFENLTNIGNADWGINKGKIYRHKDGSIYYIKSLESQSNVADSGRQLVLRLLGSAAVTKLPPSKNISNQAPQSQPIDPIAREYVGAEISRLLLDDDRTPKIKLIKNNPNLVASKKLPGGFATSWDGIKIPDCKTRNCIELEAAMDVIGLSDRTDRNVGVTMQNGRYLAARVDLDWSFQPIKELSCNEDGRSIKINIGELSSDPANWSDPSHYREHAQQLDCSEYREALTNYLNILEDHLEDVVSNALNTVACADLSFDRNKNYNNIINTLKHNRQFLQDWINQNSDTKTQGGISEEQLLEPLKSTLSSTSSFEAAEDVTLCPAKIDSQTDSCPRDFEAESKTAAEETSMCPKELESELVDLSDLKPIGRQTVGTTPGGIYEDKAGRLVFVKSPEGKQYVPPVIREYVCSRLLRLFLGNNTIALQKLVVGRPDLIGSEELPGYVSNSERKYERKYGRGEERETSTSIAINKMRLEALMDLLGIGDRHARNTGIVERNGKVYVARIDFDTSLLPLLKFECENNIKTITIDTTQFSDDFRRETSRQYEFDCNEYRHAVQEVLEIPLSYLSDAISTWLVSAACIMPSLNTDTIHDNIMEAIKHNRQYLQKWIKN